MKIILFLLAFIILNARENPFIPVVTNKNKNIITKEMLKETNTKLPSDARVLKSVTFTYQTLTGSILNQTIIINKSINWHFPLYISQAPIHHTKIKSKSNENKIKVGFLNFYLYNKKYRVFINSQDKMIRHFVLLKPFRLVLDFQAKKAFLTYNKTIENSFIKKIIMGNHDDFYRVVLYSDGVYKPVITEKKEGYTIDFK